jgi:hypothetical protein
MSRGTGRSKRGIYAFIGGLCAAPLLRVAVMDELGHDGLLIPTTPTYSKSHLYCNCEVLSSLHALENQHSIAPYHLCNYDILATYAYQIDSSRSSLIGEGNKKYEYAHVVRRKKQVKTIQYFGTYETAIRMNCEFLLEHAGGRVNDIPVQMNCMNHERVNLVRCEDTY